METRFNIRTRDDIREKIQTYAKEKGLSENEAWQELALEGLATKYDEFYTSLFYETVQRVVRAELQIFLSPIFDRFDMMHDDIERSFTKTESTACATLFIQALAFKETRPAHEIQHLFDRAITAAPFIIEGKTIAEAEAEATRLEDLTAQPYDDIAIV